MVVEECTYRYIHEGINYAPYWMGGLAILLAATAIIVVANLIHRHYR